MGRGCGRDIIAIRVGGIEFTIKVVTGNSVKALKRVRAALGKVIADSKGAATTLKDTGKSFRIAASAVTAFVAAVGAVKLLGFAKNAALLSATVTTLGIVLDNVGRIAGLNSAQLRNLEDSVKSLGITTRQARQGLAQLAQANLDLTQATKLTRIAQDAAVIAGINSSEAFNRLVVSIQRNDVRLLRNLGIVINLNNVYQRFAQRTGRTTKSLTGFEKRNILLNEVLQRGLLIQGTYEASLADVGKQIGSLSRLVEEATVAFGNQFLPTLREVVKVTTEFLKAFPKGEAFITPRTLASITAATTAFFGFGTAIGVAAAAFASLSIVGGPITLTVAAIVALGVAVASTGGLLVGLFVDSKLAAIEAQVALKNLGEEAEQTGQKVFEASKLFLQAQENQNFSGLIVDSEEFARTISDLTALFPKFAKEFERIGVSALPLRELEVFLATKIPLALKTNEEAVKELEETRTRAERNFRKALLETFQAEEGATGQAQVRVRQIREELGVFAVAVDKVQELREAEFRAQLRFNEVTKDGTEAAIIQNAVLVKSSESLAKFAKQLIEARRAAIGLRQAQLSFEFAKFEGAIRQLDDAAIQALAITSKLETKARQAFKGTAAEVALTFLEIQESIRFGAIQTDEELGKGRDAFRKSQLANARSARDEALLLAKSIITDTQKRSDEVRRILTQFSQEQQRIELSATQFVENGQRARDSIRKAEELSISNLTEALRRQDLALKNLLERTELEIRGVSPKLLNIRKRLTNSLEEQQIALRGLAGAQSTLLREISAREREILDKTGGDGTLASILGVTDRQLQRLKMSFELIAGQTEVATERAKAARRRAEFAFNKEAEAQSKKLEARERELINKINKLRALGEKDLEDITIQGVASRVKKVRAEGEELAKFLKGLKVELRGENLAAALTGDVDVFARGTRIFRQSIKTQALPALKELSDEALNLQAQLKKATSPEQVSLINRAFKLELRQAIVGTRTELVGLRKELEVFQETTRPERERENRIEQQRRFNELIDAGVPFAVAQAERDRQSIADQEALNDQEKELSDKIRQRQRAAREFETQVKTLQAEFAVELEKQAMAIQQQVADQARLNELKKEELEIIRQQGAELAANRAITAAQIAGGVTVPAGAIPAVPPTTGRVTQAAEAAILGLTGETRKIVSAEEETTSAIERLIGAFQGRGLAVIRAAAEERKDKVERLVAETIRRIDAEAKIGNRVLKARM